MALVPWVQVVLALCKCSSLLMHVAAAITQSGVDTSLEITESVYSEQKNYNFCEICPVPLLSLCNLHARIIHGLLHEGGVSVCLLPSHPLLQSF